MTDLVAILNMHFLRALSVDHKEISPPHKENKGCLYIAGFYMYSDHVLPLSAFSSSLNWSTAQMKQGCFCGLQASPKIRVQN